jgi:septum formation protein
MMPLLLASASPRRRELLAAAGVAFEVAATEVVELEASSGLPPARLAEENARLKARAAARAERWVLGADTVVALAGRIFGKPGSLDQAREFLRALSGRAHEVITGCALVGPGGAEHVFHEVTRVTFQALTDETIKRYFAAVHVLDKSGGYALQEKGEWIVESVEGSRSNVVGLPVERLLAVLTELGLKCDASGG